MLLDCIHIYSFNNYILAYNVCVLIIGVGCIYWAFIYAPFIFIAGNSSFKILLFVRALTFDNCIMLLFLQVWQ